MASSLRELRAWLLLAVSERAAFADERSDVRVLDRRAEAERARDGEHDAEVNRAEGALLHAHEERRSHEASTAAQLSFVAG